MGRESRRTFRSLLSIPFQANASLLRQSGYLVRIGSIGRRGRVLSVTDLAAQPGPEKGKKR